MGFLRDIGTPGLVVLVVGALVLFGPKRLPELGRAIGKMVAEFKKVANQLEEDIQSGESSNKD